MCPSLTKVYWSISVVKVNGNFDRFWNASHGKLIYAINWNEWITWQPYLKHISISRTWGHAPNKCLIYNRQQINTSSQVNNKKQLPEPFRAAAHRWNFYPLVFEEMDTIDLPWGGLSAESPEMLFQNHSYIIPELVLGRCILLTCPEEEETESNCRFIYSG